MIRLLDRGDVMVKRTARPPHLRSFEGEFGGAAQDRRDPPESEDPEDPGRLLLMNRKNGHSVSLVSRLRKRGKKKCH